MSLKIKILRYDDDIEPALKFRAKMMQAAFGIDPSEDEDQWDQGAYLVLAVSDRKVVGYYRAIINSDLGFYTESEFDLTNLKLDHSKILEIGRAAVHPDYRNAAVIPMLWGNLIDLSKRLNCEYIMGATSLKPIDTAVIAARDHWRETYRYLDGAHAVPLNPYDREDTSTGPVPKLLQVYQKLGACVVSDPSWDPIFHTADVVTLIDLKAVNQRWLERLL